MIIKKSKKIGKLKVQTFEGALLRYKQFPGQFKPAVVLAFKYAKDSLSDMCLVAIASVNARQSTYTIFDPSIQKTISKFTKTSIARGFLVDSTGNIFSVLLQDDEQAQVTETKKFTKSMKEAKSFSNIYNQVLITEAVSISQSLVNRVRTALASKNYILLGAYPKQREFVAYHPDMQNISHFRSDGTLVTHLSIGNRHLIDTPDRAHNYIVLSNQLSYNFIDLYKA